MSAIDDEEVAARLEAIQNGPWTPRSATARARIAAPALGIDSSELTTLEDLAAVPLDRKAKDVSNRLRRTLKPHSRNFIPSKSAQRIRDSFDDALTQLQLIELAVETGYLPADRALQYARPQLVSYLWSEPAREFVDHYGYAGVEALANRMGLSGLRRIKPRPVDPSGAIHFASFLATQRAIESDPACVTWLKFLDDYFIRSEEDRRFYDFLVAGAAPQSERRTMLVTGARNHAVMLADFLTPLPDNLKLRFGSFSLYWLAKLFWYERDEIGNLYRPRYRDWAQSPDFNWPEAVVRWYNRQTADDSDPAAQSDARLVASSYLVLKETWDTVVPPTHRIAREFVSDFSRL